MWTTIELFKEKTFPPMNRLVLMVKDDDYGDKPLGFTAVFKDTTDIHKMTDEFEGWRWKDQERNIEKEPQ